MWERELEVEGVEHSEVSGIPAYFVPDDGQGTCFGGISFRVGYVDETLVTRGVNHIVEHLALEGLHATAQSVNGSTDATLTRFHASGAPNQVAEFLNAVSAQLQSLSRDRFSTELEVLRIEKPSVNPWGDLLSSRYGAAGYGLSDYRQLGMFTMGFDDVVEYASRHYTGSNAVLYFKGAPPPGLDLQLPKGDYSLAPDAMVQQLGRKPQYLFGHPDAVVFHCVGVRDRASGAVAHVLESRLGSLLRHERGIAYSPRVSYWPTSSESGQYFGIVDSNADSGAEAARLTLWLIDTLADGSNPATSSEIAAYQSSVRTGLHNRREYPYRAGMIAEAILDGVGVNTHEDDLDRLTSDDITAAASAIRESLLIELPQGTHFDGTRLAPLFLGRGLRVPGTEYTSAMKSDDTVLVVGQAGVSCSSKELDQSVTITDVAACLCGVGRRVLVGDDSASISIDEQAWTNGRQLIDQIDNLVPRSRKVPSDDFLSDEVFKPPRKDRVTTARTRAALLALVAVPALVLFPVIPILALLGLVWGGICGFQAVTLQTRLWRSGRRSVQGDLPLWRPRASGVADEPREDLGSAG